MTVSSPNVIEIKLGRLIDDGSECNFSDPRGVQKIMGYSNSNL